MAVMDKAIKKGFIRYVNKHYPAEAKDIIKRADDLFPKLYSKAPDIGGKENIMSYNLDLLIMTASFYEASDHLMPPLVHAKLIRTHTCALGSETCDYWYVADESDAAKNFRGTIV